MSPSTKIFFAIIIASLIIGASIYFAVLNSTKLTLKNQNLSSPPTLNSVSLTTLPNSLNQTTTTTLGPTINWKLYQDPQTKLTFQYPNNFLSSAPKVNIFDCDVNSFTKDCPSLGTGATSQAIKANGLDVCLYTKTLSLANKIFVNHYYVFTTEAGCVGLDLTTAMSNCDLLKGTDSYDQCINNNNNITEVFQKIEASFQFAY